MSQESITYTVNLIIGAILAALMTQHWRSASNLRYWIVAAWVMTAADLLFALRPGLPYWVGRFFPTLMVTAGHGMLLHAARQLAGAALRPRLIATVVALHGAALVAFLATDAVSGWRTVVNGVVWGGLSFAAGFVLFNAPERIRRAMRIPAVVLLAQGGFHGFRTWLATTVAVRPDASGSGLLQLLGDLEVSLFMVALFVSVLVAHLRLSYADLRTAQRDVAELAQLLPICAWCRKVRSDDGYWEQLEAYLGQRQIIVTHGMCESCSEKQMAKGAALRSEG